MQEHFAVLAYSSQGNSNSKTNSKSKSENFLGHMSYCPQSML